MSVFVSHRHTAAIAVAACALVLQPRARADAPGRPQLEIAIGAGTEVDRNWPDDATDARPLSLGTGAIVGECFGLQLAASGMTRPVGPIPSRERADLLGLVRPVACVADLAQAEGYSARVARSLTLGTGFGFERLSQGMSHAYRTGVAISAQIDLPIVPASTRTQAAIRAGVRRFFGFDRPVIAGREIDDTVLQAYAALAIGF